MNRRTAVGIAIGVVAVIVGVLLLLTAGDADDDGAASTSTVAPTTEESTTSVEPTTTSTTEPAFDDAPAVFPDPTGSTRFDDPVAVTRAFALDLGFDDPVIGEYMAGDTRSGEIEVRPSTNGPVTTVLVRQLSGSDDWWVIGAATDAIQVRVPDALATITSPVRVQGTSTAFEANVAVVVRQDGVTAPLMRSFVMGGSNGEMGPFDATLSYPTPTADHGTIVFATYSMEDGALWEASTVRVTFGDTTACGGASTASTAEADEMVVAVYFTCGDDVTGTPIAVSRVVPRSTGVLRASLDALLAGPTADERAAGLESWFSDETAGMVTSVDLDPDGSATVDFADLRPVIPNASASAGSQLLLQQLDATVFAHEAVRSVVYRIDGSCEAFTEWLQIGGCEPHVRQEGS